MANPDLHWDGKNWYRWDGDEWVLDSSIPPPGAEEPEPVPGLTQQPNQPASEAEPRGGKGKVAALAVLGVAVVASGAAFVLTRTGASETAAIAASPSLAEPTDATEAPVTIKPEDMQNAFITSNPTGDYQPAKTTRPPTTSVQASDPGVYAGTYQMSPCDRKVLSSQLEDNPSQTMWAEAVRTKPGKISEYVDSTTPAVLRWDTYLTRGYVDESTQALTWQPVVLKAGTVVLLNEFGIPVVRCASGNPLGPAEGQPVTAKSVTVIPSVAELPGFELRQIIDNSITTNEFFRPVGTDGSEDTESSSAPEPPDLTRTPSTSPESVATPATTAPDSTSTANGERESDD